MIIILNGPLGIGKSTLAEVLTERIELCAMIEGDSLVAVNPPATDGLEHLHSAIELLVRHHCQDARAIDEREFELRTFAEEREVLTRGSDLGEPFEVSAAPTELAARLLRHLAMA